MADTPYGTAMYTVSPSSPLSHSIPQENSGVGVNVLTLASAISRASTSTSTDSSDSEDPFAHFESLLAKINNDCIISMAVRIYHERSAMPSYERVTCDLVSPPLCGSFNLLHVLNFSDGTKWILRIPMEGIEGFPTDGRQLESEVKTMHFIRRNTTIPIPNIISFDSTTENEVGWPYLMMEFVEGTPVSRLWFDETGKTPLEERRHRILDTIASAMSQLKDFSFNKIGSLQFDGDPRSDLFLTPHIGSIITLDEQNEMAQRREGVDTGPLFKIIGPFANSQEYLVALLDGQGPPESPYAIGMHKLFRMMIKCLPLSHGDKGEESFEITHPDFGGQNFLASEDGTLTAVIDWDNVHTSPLWIGCRSYPAWLTRDWDPIMYGYGNPNCIPEDSPEKLEAYRKYYAEKMESLGSARFTIKSHLYESIVIAATSALSIYEIVDKFFHHMFPKEAEAASDEEDEDDTDEDDSEDGDEVNNDDENGSKKDKNMEVEDDSEEEEEEGDENDDDDDDEDDDEVPGLWKVTQALASDGLSKKVEQKIISKMQDLLSLPEDVSTISVVHTISKAAKIWQFIEKWTGATLLFSFCAFILPAGVSSAIKKLPRFINFLPWLRVKTNVSKV
ncbi:uncharacterized protein LAJ45_05437 [Morchella importuna]|uniref:uncharacterized protein n=1 Tax=Morchella importuna TaxID=1174673 RepID=UPI001E8E0639|nr:uncharacterized protein LAJ45_05437 [Morchella importuna]KAH8150741.1 hypothetical protein LAJ45_05437 [Morchella importuna]